MSGGEQLQRRFPDIAHRCGAGEILDERYVLRAPLGAGGAGVVWSAEHLSHGGRVAIKVLGEHRDFLLTQRLRREADLLQSVRHLGLVRVYDIVECDFNGLPALVMELLRGEDLARRMDRIHGFDVVTFATLLLPAIDALVALHQRAIAHRDLKPSNLFIEIDESGAEFAKVLDLGLARCVDPDADGGVSRLTESGISVGTPQYMAPEQLMGARDVDCLADVWAAGVILFEGLSGQRWTVPTGHFRGENAQIGRRVEAMGEHVPAALRELIVQCLSLTKERRPAMKRVRDELAVFAAVPKLPAGAFKAT
jgi:serine/threonine-protein kinase